MASSTQCNVSGCDFPVYVETRCYRHFKTEDRVKDSEGKKADGKSGAPATKMAYPAGTKAADVNPKRKDSLAPDEEDKK